MALRPELGLEVRDVDSILTVVYTLAIWLRQ